MTGRQNYKDEYRRNNMIRTGQVFKFVGIKGLIRPDKFGQTRRDVLFNKNDYDFKIGDLVEYEPMEKLGRVHALDLKHRT